MSQIVSQTFEKAFRGDKQEKYQCDTIKEHNQSPYFTKEHSVTLLKFLGHIQHYADLLYAAYCWLQTVLITLTKQTSRPINHLTI